MVSKKYKISLVDKSHHSPPSKLGVLRKERCKQSSNSYAYFRVKAIEYKLWNMLRGHSMMLNMLLIFYTGHFKNSQHALQMSHQQFPTVGISQNHNMCIIQSFPILINILKLHISARIESNVMKDHHNLLKKIIYFYWWFNGSSDQYFNRTIVIQNIIELVEYCLIVFLNILLPSLLFIFYCYRFLPFGSWQLLSLFPFLHLNLVFQYITLVVHFDSLLFVFDLVRLLLKNSGKLVHGLRTNLYWFGLGLFVTELLLSRFFSCIFSHC